MSEAFQMGGGVEKNAGELIRRQMLVQPVFFLRRQTELSTTPSRPLGMGRP
jgi:hypothetical protein